MLEATPLAMIGAVLWGFGLTMLGYVIAYIPWVANLVTEYIDIILLTAVGGTAIITLWHYFSERRKVRKELAEGAAPVTDATEAQELTLTPETFEVAPEVHRSAPEVFDAGDDDAPRSGSTPAV